MSSEAAPPRIRVLVVDDEPLARSNILHLLRENADIEILGECESAAAALNAIRLQSRTLFFWMCACRNTMASIFWRCSGRRASGRHLCHCLRSYALKAFETGALDYILKPFNNARFARAVERAKQRIVIGARSRRGWTVSRSKCRVRLFLPTSDIDWIEAADYYASLHVGPRVHLLRRSMNDLESDLDPGSLPHPPLDDCESGTVFAIEIRQ